MRRKTHRQEPEHSAAFAACRFVGGALIGALLYLCLWLFWEAPAMGFPFAAAACGLIALLFGARAVLWIADLFLDFT